VAASVAGGVARAAAENSSGEKRALAMRIRRMKNLLDVNSDRHDYDPHQRRLSNENIKALFFNRLVLHFGIY
jgi:hypothetical protein